ncbi:hypothetical protein CMQ_7196 [Grosmannia clavigera kw1407]|uniref:Uncharacterized protein n=1 Tax=Grosmannia clavigera (strain kw1407 / UAMH 11150) TaxID=655863 RepID=F0XNK9_GROCL|nr:uncharacterized protein CMQ_7196 [Grosmannia clavigera kw1407]EFX00194.1 hypothetical protein CMQ_7196 [Grosmannia clavigera kw1407]
MSGTLDKQQLVPGGHLRRSGNVPETFATLCPPFIYSNSIIVAATSPVLDDSDQKQDGWFISDFYAFNYIFKNLGQHQVWLTKVDPRILVKKFGNYLHGNPFKDRKVVLSNELLDNKELTAVTIVKDNLQEKFIKEAKRASELAVQTNAPLLLMLFCHGMEADRMKSPAGSSRMMLHSKHRGLEVQDLKDVLNPSARVTLITSACYSGGWVVHPDLNNTSMAAADATSESISWNASGSIGRYCGSVFASSLIGTLTSVASPLVETGSATENPDDLSLKCLSLSTSGSLQPETPTEEQTLSYNAFCHEVVDTLRTKTRFSFAHHLTFSAQNDDWESAWMKRTGIPLAFFSDRWDKLVSCPYSGAPSRLDQDPHNPMLSEDSATEDVIVRTGGAYSDITDRVTLAMLHSRAIDLAAAFLETCPGDDDKGYGPLFTGTLRGLICGDDNVPPAAEIICWIQFRWDFALMTDDIVRQLRLPMPGGEPCLMWRSFEFLESLWKSGRTDFQERHGEMFMSLLRRGFITRGNEDQGPPFRRPAYYLAAAIVATNKSKEDCEVLADQVGAYIHKANMLYAAKVLAESPNLRRRGRNWAKSVGRNVRRSLSPKKKRWSMREIIDSDSPGSSSSQHRPSLETQTRPRGLSGLGHVLDLAATSESNVERRKGGQNGRR